MRRRLGQQILRMRGDSEFSSASRDIRYEGFSADRREENKNDYLGQPLLNERLTLRWGSYYTYRREGTGRKAGSINSTSSVPLSEIGWARLLDPDIFKTLDLQ